MSARDAAARLRALMALLALWDTCIGVYAVLFPSHLERLLGPEPQGEPIFVRGVGAMWLFVAYIQLLAFRNPVKNACAIRLSVVFRLTEAAFCTAEALFLLGPPANTVRIVLAVFAVLNVFIAFITSQWLRLLRPEAEQ